MPFARRLHLEPLEDRRLLAAGETFVLAQSDGRTISHQYASELLAQADDTSDGLAQRDTTLLAAGAAAKVLVPPDDTLGDTWKDPAFDDSAWTTATTGIGFETGEGQVSAIAYSNNSGNVGSQSYGGSLGLDFDVLRPITVTQLGVFDSGSNGLSRTITAQLWSRSGNSGTLITQLTFTPGDAGELVGGDRFKPLAAPLVVATGTYSIVAYGYGSDEPNGNFEQPPASQKGLDDGDGAIAFVGRGRFGSAGAFPTNVDLGPVNRYSAGTFEFLEPAYTDVIATDVESQMFEVNASIYSRIEFFVDDLAPIDSLTLRMKYDDAIVAYLNGVEVASRNAPNMLAYNTSALTDRPLEQSLVFEDINLTEYLGQLTTGTNVLAIHGLNVDAADSDFLILPELVASGPPVVIGSSILEGDIREAGALTYTAQFSEPMDPAGVVAGNVVLVGSTVGGVAPAAVDYDAGTATLMASFANLAVDDYTLTLLSGQGGLTDLTGSALDGERHPTTTVPSGNGTAGGDFVVHFEVQPEPFLITTTDPPAGGVASVSAGWITVVLNDAVNLDTLDPADLTLDGVPANTIDVVDNQTVTFEFSETFTAGNYNVRIAGGAFLDDDDTPVAPYAALLEFSPDPAFYPGEIVGGVPTNELTEPSGLVVSRQNPGVFWLHNDSGDTARVFAMDAQGQLLGEYHFTGMDARDWEDIAIGPGPLAGVDYLYVADTGDNFQQYSSVFIVRIPEPAVALGQTPDVFDLADAEFFELAYPDGAHDVETLLVGPLSGDVVVVSKRDTLGGVYRVTQGELVAGQVIPWEMAGTTTWGATNGNNGFTGATAGDVSVDGGEILIKSFEKIYRYYRSGGQSIAEAIVGVVPEELPYTVEPKGESVALDPATGGYYTFNESSPGPLYYYARVPDAPLAVAENDDYPATVDQPLVIGAAEGLLDNDNDPAGGPLAAFVVALPVNGQLQAQQDGSFTYQPNAGFEGLDTFTYRARGAGSVSNLATVTITVQSSGPAVVGRHVFYNRSAFDFNTLGFSAADDLAVATDKTPLLPGQTAGFANYTSYVRGINGVMIDLANAPTGSPLTRNDFEFRAGNTADPATWPPAAAPTFLTIRPGAGTDGSTRLVLIWDDPDAVKNAWLQVTVKPTLATGLAQPDVFYFGSALGDAGMGNLANVVLVDAQDRAAVRDNPHHLMNPAPVDSPYDHNRDRLVNALDRAIVQANPAGPLTGLLLFTTPGSDPAPLSEDVLVPAPAVDAINRRMTEAENTQSRQPPNNVPQSRQAVAAVFDAAERRVYQWIMRPRRAAATSDPASSLSASSSLPRHRAAHVDRVMQDLEALLSHDGPAGRGPSRALVQRFSGSRFSIATS